MSKNSSLDTIRGAALDRVDRYERNFKLAFFAGGAMELLFFIAFLMVADLSNRLHLLILIATVASYTIIILGLVALGAHMNKNTQLILKAISLIDRQPLEKD